MKQVGLEQVKILLAMDASKETGRASIRANLVARKQMHSEKWLSEILAGLEQAHLIRKLGTRRPRYLVTPARAEGLHKAATSRSRRAV